VPEHSPDFFRDLEEKLGVDLGLSDAKPPAPHRRKTPGWWRPLVPSRPLGWAAVAVVVAIVILAGVMFAPRGLLPGGPQPASAAEIKQKITQAVRQAKALRGAMVVVEYESPGVSPSEMRWEFVTTAQGDLLFAGTNKLADGNTREDKLAYDQSSGVETSYSREGNAEAVVGRRTGLATGLPDPSASDWVLERHFGAVVRALLAAQDPSVEEDILGGRKVWVLDTALQSNLLSDISSDHIQVTVDEETGFPVKITESLRGRPVRELRLENLQIDPQLTANTFTDLLPQGTEVIAQDDHFRRVDLAEAQAQVGYTPLVPSWMPDGFVLRAVAVATESQTTGKEGMNPVSRGVVSMIYGRGFDRLVISTRLVGVDRLAWSDPLASGEGFIDEPQKVVLAGGAFGGQEAELLIDPRSTPHIWSTNSRLVLTVAGDLSGSELQRVAESMQP
jgi:hypothetical protein